MMVKFPTDRRTRASSAFDPVTLSGLFFSDGLRDFPFWMEALCDSMSLPWP